MDNLKKRVLNLIEENEDFQKLLEETCDDSFDLAVSEIAVNASFKHLNNFSPPEKHLMLTATNITNEIHKIINSSSNEGALDETEIKKLNMIVSGVKDVVCQEEIDMNVFRRSLAQGYALPLQLLSILHESNILSYEQYLVMNVSNTTVIQNFTKTLIKHCKFHSEEKMCAIICEIVSILINNLQNSSHHSSKNKLMKISQIILNSLNRKLLESVIMKSSNSEKIIVYDRILKSGLVDKSILCAFYATILEKILSMNATIKVSNAFRNHHKWIFAKIPPTVSNFFLQLLEAFSNVSDVVKILDSVLKSKEVNWEMILSFLSIILICYSEAFLLISNLIESFIIEGMESSCNEKLITGFLLARQACAEGVHVFTSYSDWFQKNFESSESIISNRKNFQFFIKFLNDILPFESPQYLKVHLSKHPFVPVNCRNLWHDYVSSVKAHLGELEDSNEQKSSNLAEVDKAQKMICESVGAFEKTSKIPISIMELSIFRKPFFIGIFLPTLLEPRNLPDVPDGKMMFINDLNCAGKIPPSLFKEYLEKCEQERNNFFKEICMDDEMMEDEISDPVESLRNFSDEFISELKKSSEKTNFIYRYISQFSDKLKWVSSDQTYVEVINLSDLQITSSTDQQVLKLILDLYYTMLEFKDSHPELLISTVLQHRSLLCCIYHHLYHYISNLNDSSTTLNNNRFATLCYHLLNIEANLPQFKATSGGATESFITFLFEKMELDSKQKCEINFEIVLTFLKLFPNLDSKHIPRIVFKKLQYLGPRLYVILRNCQKNDYQDEAINYSSSEKFCNDYKILLDNIPEHQKLTFHDWSEMEMISFKDEDVIRRHKYHWWIEETYLSIPVKNGGFGGSYHNACSSLLKTILNRPSKSIATDCLIEFLQTLLLSLHQDPDDSPWLLSEIEKFVSQHDALLSFAKLDLLFDTIYSLPPYLMLCDAAGVQVFEQVYEKLSSIISNNVDLFVNYQHRYDYLSPHFVIHILKAFKQTKTNAENICSFIEKTPLILASLIYHWRRLTRSIKNLKILGLESIILEIESCCDVIDRHQYHLPNVNFDIDSWKLGLMFHSQFQESNSLMKVDSNFINPNYEILEVFMIFRLMDLSIKFANNENKLKFEKLECFYDSSSWNPIASMLNFYNHQTFMKITPKIVKEIILFVALRYYTCFIPKVTHLRNGLQSLLKMHLICSLKLEQYHDKESVPDGMHQLYLDGTLKISNYLTNCLIEVIIKASKNKKLECHEDLHEIIKQRLDQNKLY